MTLVVQEDTLTYMVIFIMLLFSPVEVHGTENVQ